MGDQPYPYPMHTRSVLLFAVCIATTLALPHRTTDPSDAAILEGDDGPMLFIPLERVKVGEHKVVHREMEMENEDGSDDLEWRMVAMLENHKTTQYVGPIFVGNPQQRIDVIWDTGSSNTWVYAQSCETDVCRSHQRYDHAASSTYRKNGQGMVIKYGSGSIEGMLSEDTVSFCTTGPQCHTYADNLKFGEVSWTSGDSFLWGQYSGIVGLGFPSLAIDGTTPPFDAMFLSGKFPNPVFAFYMTKKPNEAGSSLTVGGVQKQKYTGPVHWHRVFVKDKTPEYWTLKLSDVLIDGVSMGVCQPNGCPIAVDTGTSLITGPSSMINRLVQKINVDPECKNFNEQTHTLPRIGLVIDDITYDLDPVDYVINVEESGQRLCLGGFRDLDLPPEKGPLWIAGDVFLRRYYSIYDRNGLKVGLAQAA
eukprot:c8165_g1_i1.p1 GENE.c8165_g1_i1~~c8165_g1_i1.p1  ORF type:complete len:421 (-),score=112.00 c8165_g1_i1:81-1343(-)